LSQKRKKDKIDWRDDLLTGIELAIVIIMSVLFYTYLENNPTISELLEPAKVGLVTLSFGVFLGLFLIVKWLNREKV